MDTKPRTYRLDRHIMIEGFLPQLEKLAQISIALAILTVVFVFIYYAIKLGVTMYTTSTSPWERITIRLSNSIDNLAETLKESADRQVAEQQMTRKAMLDTDNLRTKRLIHINAVLMKRFDTVESLMELMIPEDKLHDFETIQDLSQRQIANVQFDFETGVALTSASRPE